MILDELYDVISNKECLLEKNRHIYQSLHIRTIIEIKTKTNVHAKNHFCVGKEVSLFVKNYYLNQLISQETFREGNIEAALADSFHHMDEMLNVIVRMSTYCNFFFLYTICFNLFFIFYFSIFLLFKSVRYCQRPLHYLVMPLPISLPSFLSIF